MSTPTSRLPPSSQAVQGYENEALNELLEQQLVTQDQTERMALVGQV